MELIFFSVVLLGSAAMFVSYRHEKIEATQYNESECKDEASTSPL